MERVVQQTELTVVFTREGKIVIPTDKEGRYSFFPKYYVGLRDGDQKNLAKGEVGAFLVKSQDEEESQYKMHMAGEIGKRDKRYDEKTIEAGWVIGNKQVLTDFGQLSESIYSHQVAEMKGNLTGYIRDGRNTFYLKTVNNIEVYENVGYRFLVLPKDYKDENFRGLSSYSLEELVEILKTHPSDCTLDLLIAMKQVNRDKIKKFIEEIAKRREVDYEDIDY